MFNTIKQVNVYDKQVYPTVKLVRKNTAMLAEGYNIEPDILVENVVDVLSQLEQKIKEKTAIESDELISIAAFLSGVEELTNQIEDTSKHQARETALDVLSSIGTNPNGSIPYSVSPIVKIGMLNKQLLDKYTGLVKQYTENSVDSLSAVIGQLRNQVEFATRTHVGDGETTYDPTIAPATPGIM